MASDPSREGWRQTHSTYLSCYRSIASWEYPFQLPLPPRVWVSDWLRLGNWVRDCAVSPGGQSQTSVYQTRSFFQIYKSSRNLVGKLLICFGFKHSMIDLPHQSLRVRHPGNSTSPVHYSNPAPFPLEIKCRYLISIAPGSASPLK